jgi:hypothetical protein
MTQWGDGSVWRIRREQWPSRNTHQWIITSPMSSPTLFLSLFPTFEAARAAFARGLKSPG